MCNPKNMSKSSLLFVVKDCTDAINAMPESQNVAKYSLELLNCTIEIQRRKAKGTW